MAALLALYIYIYIYIYDRKSQTHRTRIHIHTHTHSVFSYGGGKQVGYFSMPPGPQNAGDPGSPSLTTTLIHGEIKTEVAKHLKAAVCVLVYVYMYIYM